jgi:hypothetical protein
LNQFVRLADMSSADFETQVLAFASHWGVLRICEHEQPAGHAGYQCLPDGGAMWLWNAGQMDVVAGWEKLEAWRRYSGQLLGLLNIGDALRDGSAGREVDWRRVRDAETSFDGYHPLGASGGASVAHSQLELSRAVTRWFQYGMVTPVARYDGAKRKIEVKYASLGLAGLLAIQLAAALQRGTYCCAGCDYPFTPETERRPRSDKKTWCPACGTPEQQRQYQRRRYRQKRSPAANGSKPNGHNASDGA